MKTLFVTVGIVIALVVGFSVACFAINVRNQTAIVHVFSEQSRDAAKIQGELKEIQEGRSKSRLSEIQRALKSYSQAVQSIDYSTCPTRFRIAWFNYTSAVSDMSDKNFAASGFKDLLELAMSAWTKDGKLTENVVQDANSLNRPSVCLRQCQRVAISYGISFRPVSNQQSN